MFIVLEIFIKFLDICLNVLYYQFVPIYKKYNLRGGHVIMLGSGNEAAALAALRAYPGGLQVGGGINPNNAPRFLDAGASHVIVTSYVFREGRIDRERLKKLVGVVGKDRLVLDLSCRVREEEGSGGVGNGGRGGAQGKAYYIVTDRWQRYTETQVTAASLKDLSQYCSEFLVHAVDVEGKQGGVDESLIALLGTHSPIPCTYAGGVRDLEDVQTVSRLGKGMVHVTIGSALDIFGGSLPLQTVLEFFKTQEEGGKEK